MDHPKSIESFGVAILIALSLALSYTISVVISRIYFHRLRQFPGPKLAAATFWYEIYYDLVKRPGGQFTYHLDYLHDKYGPIIRCSPDEIHIRDSEFFDTLYAGPGHIRDKWEKTNRANGSPGSVASAWQHDLHRSRRAAINPFFSKRAVNELDNSVRNKTQKLCEKLRACAEQRKNVDIGTAFTAVTLDVITEYCYDRCQNTLDEADFAPRWKQLMTGLFEAAPVSKHFPIVMQLLQSLPRPVIKVLNPTFAPFFEAKDSITAQAREVWLEKKDGSVKDNSENAEGKPRTIFHGILQSNLPEHEKSLARLQDEAFVLIVAGGDTTARTATVILAHLLQNKNLLRRLRAEIDPVMKHEQLPASAILDGLPLMKAVVQEGLRISAPVSSRTILIAPNEDLTYQQWTIPRGTPTSMTSSNVLYDTSIFPNPRTFDPDRWLRAAEQSHRLDRYLVTFSKGNRACLGQGLAYAEIYLTVAAVISRFDMQLVDFDQKRDMDTVRDNFIGLPSKQSRGVRVEVKVRGNEA